MSVLQRFEKRLSGLVEGGFARVFRGRVEPVELAAALAREADTNKAVGAHSVLVPNVYDVELGSSDYARLAPYRYTLADELAELLTEHSADQGYSFVGAVAVTLLEAEDLSTGAFRVTSRVEADEPGQHPGPAHRYTEPVAPAEPGPWPPPTGPVAGYPDDGVAEDEAEPVAAEPEAAAAPAGGPAWFGSAPGAAAAGAGAAAAAALGGAAAARAGALPSGNVRPVRAPGRERPGFVPDAEPALELPVEPPERTKAPAANVTTIFARPPAAQGYGSFELANGSLIAITGREQIVGRGKEADIQVAESSVSRRHARVLVQRGKVVLEDLGSTNGTTVNGRRIDKANLADGDRITLGAATATFRA